MFACSFVYQNQVFARFCCMIGKQQESALAKVLTHVKHIVGHYVNCAILAN